MAHWYKDAVLYELHVRSFSDSDGDGIGDFPGLASKLDYLKDLGVTALWLLPFYPSPLRDDGYDIADYMGVHPFYGTLDDFKRFLEAAHRRGLRVVTELVLNHTSDQHPWFQRSRRAAPGSPWRDFYVWSDTPEKYREARIIFKDFEPSNWTWDPVAKAYFWHRFYSHQPDLNFDNPQVREAMRGIVDFWLGMGVDGLRLDAVPYLYEREGSNCENLPETHAFLKTLRKHVDEKYGQRMLLAEANQWPEDAAAYFGSGAGDECHAAFHFPLMPRLFTALLTEDRFPVVDILEQTPSLPEAGQWMLFLRNHDELTLEMVTDVERDYMYRFYAQDPQARLNLGIRRRLAPLLGNDRRRIELMMGLLFSLPGTPVLYYGDEIGMGDNMYLGDRNGVRTPMQWNADRNAGFSKANSQRLYLPVVIDPEYHYEALNVEVQQNNAQSLLWWMKRLIALRKRFAGAFGRGTLEMLAPDNPKILAFLRRHEGQDLLVVANLSRLTQYVELDLSAFAGRALREMFGRTQLPAASERPYPLTLGPHSFHWFSLVPAAAAAEARPPLPALETAGEWDAVFEQPERSALEETLAAYLSESGRLPGRQELSVRIVEVLRVSAHSALLLLELRHPDGRREPLLLPIGFCAPGRAEARPEQSQLFIAPLKTAKGEGWLCDASAQPEFAVSLLKSFAVGPEFAGEWGRAEAAGEQAFAGHWRPEDASLEPAARVGTKGSRFVFKDRYLLKLYANPEPGADAEADVTRYLAQKGFAHIRPVLGTLEYRPHRGARLPLGALYAFVPAPRSAWEHALDSLGRYFERVLTLRSPGAPAAAPSSDGTVLRLATQEFSAQAVDLIGPFLEEARLLGSRSAQLHRALASGDGPAFVAEPFSALDRRETYQSMRTMTRQVSQVLRRSLRHLNDPVRADAERVIALEEEALKRFRAVMDRKLTGRRIRCHGDYHLGHVLYTGKDFIITGFSDRRSKQSPLKDVAAMLRSFHYAAASALAGRAPGVALRPEDRGALLPWSRYWRRWVCGAFLQGYLADIKGAPFMPETLEEFDLLLGAFLGEKAVEELNFELNRRPEWISIALQEMPALLEAVGYAV